VLGVNGCLEVAGTSTGAQLMAGQIFYVTADENELAFTGSGTGFLATSA
jgi:cyanophycinase-like exopeptidase